MEETGNFGETYVMMYALETLHNRGITVKETVYESIHNLNQWYEQSGNYKYLELALLLSLIHIWQSTIKKTSICQRKRGVFLWRKR